MFLQLRKKCIDLISLVIYNHQLVLLITLQHQDQRYIIKIKITFKKIINKIKKK